MSEKEYLSLRTAKRKLCLSSRTPTAEMARARNQAMLDDFTAFLRL